MSKMNDLLTELNRRELTQTQISAILAELTKMSSSKIFVQLVSSLKDEDKDLLEENKESDEMSEGILSALYKKYYGKTADEAVEELQEEFAENFLNNLD